MRNWHKWNWSNWAWKYISYWEIQLHLHEILFIPKSNLRVQRFGALCRIMAKIIYGRQEGTFSSYAQLHLLWSLNISIIDIYWIYYCLDIATIDHWISRPKMSHSWHWHFVFETKNVTLCYRHTDSSFSSPFNSPSFLSLFCSMQSLVHCQTRKWCFDILIIKV